MSDTRNPTALRLGATGMLDGRRYTVRGRVVMSVTIDGETYYWNEFRLVDQSDGEITLVFEETEDGAEWKIFKLFEPLRPLSASAAAKIEVGDDFELGDRSAAVTMVDQSRVAFVEGDAPEGVTLGKVANYFNADAGERMIVVSWSGEEIEYFEGSVTSALRVEGAFGLPKTAALSRSLFSASSNQGGDSNSGIIKIGIVVVSALALVAYFAIPSRGDRASAPPPKRTVSASHLPAGATGLLDGHRYRVRGHALVEISRLGDRFDEHEYALSTTDDDRAMLVKALQGKSTDWYLLKSGVAPDGFGPFEAASLRQDRLGLIGGRSLQVAQLFQARVIKSEGEDLKMLWPVGLQYGFLARDGSSWMLARWNEGGLQFCNVQTVSDEAVHAAFGPDKPD